MKKSHVIFAASFIIITAGIMIGCKKNTPSTPEPTQNTATMTSTISGSLTVTPTISPTNTITATATVTDTPDYGIISGNLVLPSGQAQNGVIWEVLVDNDLNFTNGVVNMALGTCGANESVPYSVTAPAGTYYVYALIKTQSALTQPPVQGDYLGIHGAAYPNMPAGQDITVVVNTTTSGNDINMVQAANNVTGTITMPAPDDGKNIIIILDDDGDASNGGISYYQVSQISGMGAGDTYSYGALCVFAGNYYVTAEVDNNGHGLPGAPVHGDYVGVTGSLSMDQAASNGPYDFSLIALP